VTAHDFEWAWKRNLGFRGNPLYEKILFDVVGARLYHEGQNPDPECIGVRALDDLTFEVRLVQPVAYFPYVLSLPVTFPLPRPVIERFGDSWWQPEHIVSNGPFRLAAFDSQRGGTMERNSGYHGEFHGNIYRIEWKLIPEPDERLHAYLDDRADIIRMPSFEYPISLPGEQKRVFPYLFSRFILFNPTCPPFDDIRIRRAFALALDRSKISKLTGFPSLRGGMIPPGIPGHSPEIGLGYDIEAARRLLSEADFAGSLVPPVIIGGHAQVPSGSNPWAIALADGWRASLGVDIELENRTSGPQNFVLLGWIADYPDPDNFTRNFSALFHLRYWGWWDAGFDRLVDAAAQTADRTQRLAMYRQADRQLVSEQVLVLPVDYAGTTTYLVKPWVKSFKVNALAIPFYKDIIIEDH
jgi:oligopeptide transport system substrate-binding protein